MIERKVRVIFKDGRCHEDIDCVTCSLDDANMLHVYGGSYGDEVIGEINGVKGWFTVEKYETPDEPEIRNC